MTLRETTLTAPGVRRRGTTTGSLTSGRSGLRRRAVLVVGDALAPFGLGLPRVRGGTLPRLTAAGLDQPDALGDVERLCPTAWACEAVRAHGAKRTVLTRMRDGSSPLAMTSK
jgi:hypothetical protein